MDKAFLVIGQTVLARKLGDTVHHRDTIAEISIDERMARLTSSGWVRAENLTPVTPAATEAN